MRVVLVTSTGECGIAAHSEMLMEYVGKTDRTIEFVSDPAWLDPIRFFADASGYDVVHINHHRGLHSRWLPEVLSRVKAPTVVTLHDTYETQPDSLPWDLLQVCDAMVVHEPCDLAGYYLDNSHPARPDAELKLGAKVRYWRQGVPEPPAALAVWTHYPTYPVVGTFGFDFPWKGFNLLCEAAESVGWGVHVLSNNMTAERILELRKLNRRVQVTTQFQHRDTIISALMQCDATAFLYQCANSGTSGAIRLGIAAGKPLIASKGCRQFRDLADSVAPYWVDPTVESIGVELIGVVGSGFDGQTVALRERDSWRHLGAKYAALYRAVIEGKELPQ